MEAEQTAEVWHRMNNLSCI